MATKELELLAQGEQPLLHIAPRKQGSEKIPIPPRYHLVLSLHLAGKKGNQIAEITGYSKQTIYRILKNEAVTGIRQLLLDGVQMEFEALYEKVVETIERNLEDPDPAIQMQAVNSYLRERERITGKQGSVNITAEDVVVQILNQYGGKQ